FGTETSQEFEPNPYKDISTIIKDPKLLKTVLQNLAKLTKKLAADTTPLKDTNEEKQVKALYDKIFGLVVNPSIEVLTAMANMSTTKFTPEASDFLDFGEEDEAPDPIETYRDTDHNAEITDKAFKFFEYSEKEGLNAWKRAFAESAISESMSMAILDGNQMDVDRGMFQRFYDPQAALAILFNDPKFYRLDGENTDGSKEGQKVLIESKIAKEITRLIIKGLQIGIHEYLFKKDKTEEEKAKLEKVETLITTLEGLNPDKIDKVLDLAETNPELMLAFQIGFIGDKNEKADNQKENVMEIIDSLPQNDPKRIILETLKKDKKVNPKELIQTYHALVGAGYIAFGVDGEFKAAGLGTSLKVNEELTLSFALGTNGPSLGLTVSLVRNNNREVTMTMGGSIAGGVIQLNNTEKNIFGIEGVDFKVGAGGAITWVPPFVLPLGNIGVDWTRRIDVGRKEQEEKAKENSPLKTVLEKWPTMDSKEKRENVIRLLNDIPVVKTNIESIEKEHPGIFGMLNEDQKAKLFVGMVDSYINSLKEGVNKDVSPYWIAAVGVGFAYLDSTEERTSGGAACMGFKIYIPGSEFEAFIPSLKETTALSKALSSTEIDAQINKWLKGEKVAFREKGPDLYYKPGTNLGLGTRTESRTEKYSDSGDLTTDMNQYNVRLKPAEIKLNYDEKTKRTELIIKNYKDRNIEINIDPLIKDLKLVKENGRLFLVGNIANLIISREKFNFPFPFDRDEDGVGTTNLLDVITIRTDKSMEGNRNRETVETLSPLSLRMTPDQDEFMPTRGMNAENIQGNILDYDSAKTDEEKNKLKSLESEASKFTPTHLDYQIGTEDLAKKDKISERKFKSLNQSKEDIADLAELTPEMIKFAYDTFFPFIKKDLAKLTDIGDDTALSNLVDKKWSECPKQDTSIPSKLGETQHQQVMSLLGPKWWSIIYPHSSDDKMPTNLHEQRHEKLSANINEYLVLEPGCFVTKEFKVRGKGMEHLTVKITNKRDVIIVDENQKTAFYVRNYDLNDANSWDTIPASGLDITSVTNSSEVLKQCSAEIKKQDAENQKINEAISKRLEQRINFTKKKFLSQFAETKTTLFQTYGVKINTPETELVEKFIHDLYDNLRATLNAKPPVDFRSLGLSALPEGCTLLSASREVDAKGKKTPSMQRIIGYNTMPKEEGLIHGYGFLDITQKNYENALKYSEDERKADPEKMKEYELALILLEIASPGGLERKIKSTEDLLDKNKDEAEQAKEWTNYFKSPFVLKVYGIKALELLSKEGNSEKVIEIVETLNNPDLKGEARDKAIVEVIEKNKDALLEFNTFVENLRKAQLKQHPWENGVFKQTAKGTEYVIEIDMSKTVILGGAFAKCTNPSFAVHEDIEIRIYNPIKATGETNTTEITLNAELTKAFGYVDLIGAVTYGGTRKPKEGKYAKEGPKSKPDDDKKDGKKSNEGTKDNESASPKKLKTHDGDIETTDEIPAETPDIATGTAAPTDNSTPEKANE
ncbi:MAG: hypothetical protein PHP74_01105, partial [Candidatus Gracilibacteria bacterium]|nr:hypothetical protein [Candidatus Gracilibacteria bacterium]